MKENEMRWGAFSLCGREQKCAQNFDHEII
jgi:hypothetical protein